MERYKFTIKQGGHVDIEVEGVVGSTCELKAEAIEVFVAGADKKQKDYKPEYYDSNPDELVNIFLNK